MTILLVDDERPAVEALLTSVDWRALGFDRVESACDAQAAQAILERGSVSVLLCDIEMPGRSGLELLQWVKAHRPDTVSILFTCHADFDYARRAVALGAFDYLLKPAAMDAVRQTVSRAAEEWRRRQAKARREGQWEKNKGDVEERFWLETTLGELPENGGRLRAAAARRGVELEPEGQYLLIVCALRQWNSPLTDWQTVDLDYAMKNVLAELFTFAAPPAVVSDSPQRKLLLLPCGEAPERAAIEERGRRFFDAIGRYFKAQACFYVGTPAPLEGLARQHRLLSALERQNISYSGQVFFSGQDRSAPAQTEAAPLERWQRLLERLDADALCREVHSWLLRQVERRSMNARTLELFYHDFLQMLYTVLAQHNISAAQLLRDQDLDTARILSSLESTEAQLAHMVRRSCAYLEDMRQENILVERVKAYIDQHLTEDLSRDLLAGLVFLNPNYLSRLFHQETGSSLVDYITQRRVAQVKHLLRTTSLSVTEAAGQLGYTNMPYFSRVFKKEVGCSPVEFRRSLRPGK